MTLHIYHGNKNSYVVLEKNKKGDIRNTNLLIVGSVGSGKTVQLTSIMEWFKEKGYTIIYLTDFKDKLESAMSMFEPEAEYHLEILDRMGLEKMKYEILIHHPFTFDIPRHKIPQTEFYTIPIKSFTDKEIKFLLETETENSATFNILHNTLQQLKANEGLHHYINRIRKATEKRIKEVGGKEIETYDPNLFFVKDQSATNILNIKQIASLFKPFENHYFLREENCELNLDVKKILRDNKHIHIFTTRYIKTPEKVKDFTLLWIYNQFMQNIDVGSKNGVLFILDEIKEQVPKKPQGYKMQLRNIYKRGFTTLRVSKVSHLAGTQVISETDPSLESIFKDRLFGRITASPDLNIILNNYKLSGSMINRLQSLNVGEFVIQGEKAENRITYGIMPRCRVMEEGDLFDDIYRRFYSEKMQDYNDLLSKARKELDEIRKQFDEITKKERSEKELEVRRNIKQEKEKDLSKNKIKELEAESKIKKHEDKDKRNRLIMNMFETERLTVRQISKEMMDRYNIKISFSSVQKIIKEQELLKKNVT